MDARAWRLSQPQQGYVSTMFAGSLAMISRAAAAAIWIVVFSSTIAPVAQAPRDQHDAHRLHGDPAAYIAALEDPEREAYQKPHQVIEALAVKKGEVIADIGAGS